MRLRDLTPKELAALEKRRAEVRDTLAKIQAGWKPGEAALATAPFLDAWEVTRYPGSNLPNLEGDCWGHPTLGNRWVRTSPILHLGDGFAVTENRVYILGREWKDTREAKMKRILSGRRGAGRVEPGATSEAEPEVDAPKLTVKP